ncbi:MAG: PilN domain-containing protein [Acidobacteria bacterium]|nr:PilN domain-containing protein [Acidobacteriota bacterium]
MKQLLPQSGIGIEFRHGNLYAFYCRQTWKRFRVVDRMEIAEYQKLAPQECGKRYREFLRRNGLKAPWTVVALPRSQVLLRMVRFPKGIEKDLMSAVQYQLDALHPFEEGAVVWDHAIWKSDGPASRNPASGNEAPAEPGDIQVLVAIAQKAYIEGLADWFREAGIPVSQFSVTTTLLLGFLSSEIAAQMGSGEPYFLLHATEEAFELIGCAAGKGLVSREIPVGTSPPPDEEKLVAWLGRELDLVQSGLRLEPVERPRVRYCGRGTLPESAWDSGSLPFQAVAAADDASLQENVAGMAAAFAALHRNAPLSLNLLPEARRSFEPPLAAMPTYALAALVVLLAVAMGLRGSLQDWMYSRYLERERQALLPQIEEVEKVQGANQDSMAQLATLAGFRRSGALPLDLLDELTRTLPADAWLQQLQYDGSVVTLSGTAPSASAVLQALSSSSYLEAAQFSAALNRTPDGKEVFRIGARLRASNP